MKKQLWKVPVFCIAAGFLATWATIWLGRFFYVVKLPDNEYSIDSLRSLIWYAAILAVTYGLGWLWVFRDMKRREIFFSALLWSGILAVIAIVQTFWGSSPAVIALSVRIYPIWEWSGLVSNLLFRLTGQIWPGSIAGCLMPLTFTLLGKQ